MKYSIYLKHSDGVLKVSEFESEPAAAPRAFALYLSRHYPVRFTNEPGTEATDLEDALEDCRTGKIVWKKGSLASHLEQGGFFAEPDKSVNEDFPWWKNALPASKRESIELEIQNAWKNGFEEGYSKAGRQ